MARESKLDMQALRAAAVIAQEEIKTWKSWEIEVTRLVSYCAASEESRKILYPEFDLEYESFMKDIFREPEVEILSKQYEEAITKFGKPFSSLKERVKEKISEAVNNGQSYALFIFEEHECKFADAILIELEQDQLNCYNDPKILGGIIICGWSGNKLLGKYLTDSYKDHKAQTRTNNDRG